MSNCWCNIYGAWLVRAAVLQILNGPAAEVRPQPPVNLYITLC
jgi:hypothetical protein